MYEHRLNNLRVCDEVLHESFECRNTNTLNDVSQELRIDFPGRNYAYRFGEPTDIELWNELKIPSPASRPASASTLVRLLRGATCVCLLSALDRSATLTDVVRQFALNRQLDELCFKQKLMWSFVQTYVGCPNPCRRRADVGARRGVCEATAAAAFPACARCILPLCLAKCIVWPTRNLLAEIIYSLPVMSSNLIWIIWSIED